MTPGSVVRIGYGPSNPQDLGLGVSIWSKLIMVLKKYPGSAHGI